VTDKLLKDLTVAEVEELILPGYDEDGDEVEYEYTWKGFDGKEHKSTIVLDSWNAWQELADSDVVLFLPGLGRVEVIEADTGGEGATDMQMVFQVTSLIDGYQRLFAIEGYWVSHDGGYWDGPFHEVKRQTKVVTYYS
jgi:hypothetical protein